MKADFQARRVCKKIRLEQESKEVKTILKKVRKNTNKIQIN